MVIRKGFGVIVLVVAVAVALAVTVGVGVYIKSKDDQTLGYKTQNKLSATKTKPSSKQLGLSAGNNVADIDADIKTVNFDGLDAYLNEVSANITTR